MPANYFRHKLYYCCIDYAKTKLTRIDFHGALQRLQSPIHIAAEQGYSEICKLLLSAGANIEQREQVNINFVN